MNVHRSIGFTLIEMLIVLAIGAMMAAIVTVRLTGTFQSARAADVAGRIETFDRLTREHVRRFGRPSRLEFDLGRDTVTRAADDARSDSAEPAGAALHLPSGFHLGCIVTAGGTATSGRVSIRCSTEGQTPSYAIGLTDVKGKRSWVVTAGLTGKTLKVSDEQEVQDIFRTLRDDAR